MIPRPRSLPRAFGKGQRGAYLVIMAVGMLVLIGFVGLAVDLARQMVVHAKLQNAVDACALAAVVELNGLSDAKGRSDAVRAEDIGNIFLRKNLPTSDRPAAFLSGAATSEVSTGSSIGTDGNPVPSVTCKATDTNANFFIQVLDAALGKSTMTATATATATPSSLACVTPLMIRSSAPLTDDDVGKKKFRYSETGAEGSFSVMQNTSNGRGHTQIGNLDGLEGWCSVPFDGTTLVWIEQVRPNSTAAGRVARGWCERWGGNLRSSSLTSHWCDGATASALPRRYTTVAVVDPGATTSRNAKGIKDSACVELTGAPPSTPTSIGTWFADGTGPLELTYLGRHDRRCISQGVPGAATSARGPLVPALVE